MRTILSALIFSALIVPLHAQEVTSLERNHRVGSEQVVSLEIPSQLSGSAISPLLFGHNFEITRKASWQGLSAEMLANRKFAAVGTNGVQKKWPPSGTQAWTERVLSLAGNDFDAYSYHEYIEPLESIPATAVAPLTLTHGVLEGLCATVNRLASSPRPKTIFLDEWNLWDAWNRTPGIQEGLYAGVMLHMLCRQSSQLGIEGACYFQPVNEGAIRVLPTTAELTPVGRVFSILTAHSGEIPVKATGNLGPCDILASLSSDGRSLTVTAINVEEQGSRVSFRIAGARVERVGAATAYAALSSAASSDVVRSGIEVVRSGEGTWSVVLPALSFTKIEFQIAKRQ